MMENTDSQAIMAMTGLEALRAMIAGQFAPPTIAATMGFTLVEVEHGFAAFEGEPSARVLNPMGAVHGGWALTLIDSCTGCAGHTTLPAGVGYGTVETKVNFVRPIAPTTGKLRAEGRVLALGRTLITAEGKLTDARGKLYAHGTSTCMIIRPEKSK
jgi:uncharacterized protein (TIGR00369 family)